MGAEFWSYHVPYQEDVGAALEALREQEFLAGRFWQPSEVTPGFFARIFGGSSKPVKPKLPKSIREALKLSDATGTRSILDMERISEKPDYGAISRIPPDELKELMGTEKPTREMVEDCEELYERLQRGQGIYLITYKDGKPEAIYFAGYSYD